jgi:hypothetical protein
MEVVADGRGTPVKEELEIRSIEHGIDVSFNHHSGLPSEKHLSEQRQNLGVVRSMRSLHPSQVKSFL